LGSALNEEMSPCEDFYQFMCGGNQPEGFMHKWDWNGHPKMIPYDVEKSCVVGMQCYP